MKVLFAGPSFGDSIKDVRQRDSSIDIRPPAAWGDVTRAVNDGARRIGIVDGYFECKRSVWHKEILHAMSQGVQVAGASSIGALRAAECAAFGMVGIGKVYKMYASGELTDDSDVALVHAPAEMHYRALSLPRVNVLLTFRRLAARGYVNSEDLSALELVARRTIYAELNTRTVIDRVFRDTPQRAERLAVRASEEYVDQKRQDAHALVDWLTQNSASENDVQKSWSFNETSQWLALRRSRQVGVDHAKVGTSVR
jgi:hypothetical protein